jgi:hypothetical protein
MVAAIIPQKIKYIIIAIFFPLILFLYSCPISQKPPKFAFAPTQKIARGELRCGWSKIKITPSIRVPLAGYWAWGGEQNEGVHDDLYARTIILDNGYQRIIIVSQTNLPGYLESPGEFSTSKIGYRSGVSLGTKS